MALARHLLALGLGAGLALACGGPEGSAPDAGPRDVAVPEGELFDPGGWTAVSADADPFGDRPAEVACHVGGYGPEGLVFEVETDICGYVTATQALAAPIPAGAHLTSVVWHLALTNEAPATGHIALRVGEHLVFEARPQIPGPEAFYTIDWAVPEDLPAGTPAYFHVHNHGYNSYRLGPVEAK